jgi:hypothetical protein
LMRVAGLHLPIHDRERQTLRRKMGAFSRALPPQRQPLLSSQPVARGGGVTQNALAPVAISVLAVPDGCSEPSAAR